MLTATTTAISSAEDHEQADLGPEQPAEHRAEADVAEPQPRRCRSSRTSSGRRTRATSTTAVIDQRAGAAAAGGALARGSLAAGRRRTARSRVVLVLTSSMVQGGTQQGRSARAPGRAADHRLVVVVRAQPQRAVRRPGPRRRPRRSAPPGGRGARRRTPPRRVGSSGIASSASGGSTSRSTTAAQPVTSRPPRDRGQRGLESRSGGSCSCSTGVSDPAADSSSRPIAAASVGLAAYELARWRPARRAGRAGPSRPRRCATRSRGPPPPARGRRRAAVEVVGQARLALGHGAARAARRRGPAAQASRPSTRASSKVSTLTSRMSPLSGAVGVRAVVGGHQEQLGPGVAGADDLLLDAADRADVAVGVDLAGAGDSAAAGQRARGQGVVDRPARTSARRWARRCAGRSSTETGNGRMNPWPSWMPTCGAPRCRPGRWPPRAHRSSTSLPSRSTTKLSFWPSSAPWIRVEQHLLARFIRGDFSGTP